MEAGITWKRVEGIIWPRQMGRSPRDKRTGKVTGKTKQ
jgi:hypothetical protein